MKKDMLWGIMIYLGDHMWDDETTPPRGWYLDPIYTENMRTTEKAWDMSVQFMAERQYNMALIDVGDGIKYESHPEISVPNAWDKDFLRKKLNEMRALGIEPIPKLNFSTCHDTWMKQYRRMVSTPTYYQFCADVIREVCEVFDHPRFFHLGCDEEEPEHQKTFEMTVVRHADLWWHDFYFLCRECEKNGTRPWIWSDYLWKNEELFLRNMPKDVLQSNWFYGDFKDYGDNHPGSRRSIECYELLDKHGFEQIPTGSTWSRADNLYQTVGHGKNKLDQSRLLGFLGAPWSFTDEEGVYTLFNEANKLYLARKKWYPETLKKD